MHGERIFGLDLMRATAIVLVVFWHNADLLVRFVPGFTPGPLIDGVDLFFVLSGYLIGGILLRYAAQEGVPLWRRVLDFWQRRWLRTLPNYYLFLFLNIALVYFGLANGELNHNTWAYAFFLQNAWKPVDLFFWESWSLVVEEWYYLLFPPLFFAAFTLLRSSPRSAFLLVTLLLVTFSTGLRCMLVQDVASVFELEEGVRKLMVTRLDTLGIGMLAIWTATGFPKFWERWRHPLFAVGLAGVYLNAAHYGNAHLNYSSTWYFTIGPLCMALLLPVLASWRKVPSFGRPVVFVSLVSYALYLVHQPVRSLLNPVYAQQGSAAGLLTYSAFWLLCFLLAWLVYRFWERRFMDLRGQVGSRILRVTPSSRP